MPYILDRSFSILSIHSAFAEDRATNFYFKGEMHDFWEVVYVSSGQIGVTEDERVYELEKGDIIFHKPMEFHKVWSRGEMKPRVLTMSFKTEGLVPEEIGDGILHLSTEEAAEFRTIFSAAVSLMKTESNPSAFNDQEFSSALEHFIIHITKTRKADTTLSESPDAVRFRTVISTMHSHIHEDLSVNDIARLSHMAPSTMKNAFMKFSDCGVRKHFIRMKLAASIVYLKKGLTIAEISNLFSFSSQNYFSLVFKLEMGVSPTEYKKKYLY